jgi:Ni/Co efflux regulator RcnB
MKRIVVGGLSFLLAVSAPLASLAQTPPPMDRRPPGIAQPVGGKPGGPNRPGPGAKPPPRPMPGKPGVRPPNGGHHHRPPHRPGHRPPNRPIYGWNGHRYRAGLFRYPPGYAYRRWAAGQSLPLLFMSSAYYFTNYSVLGLDPPPYGYQWIRYGPDVMLVNNRNGEILDVVYGVFY